MSRRSQSLDLDAGPDQGLAVLLEQVTARLQAGEPVDADELAAAHPEHAERLRQLLPSLRLLADASRHGLNGLSPSAALTGLTDDLSGEPLGDFRLLREVGRGGMGVVYEAEQLSLRRRVALKVLPWAAALDPKQLQRFKNEALAAASLKHDHIVQVFAVGCERGVHFYAMEYVEGQTLAQLIAALHRGDRPPAAGDAILDYPPSTGAAPTAAVAALSTERTGPKGREFYRWAAGLIAQAADALEHAHGLGIVHRDVKPGNLLVDEAGKLYVSDFGLARFGPDAGLTVSGDLLGTLRYMAPEQALARHGLVDHRTDVYSLGATLYELLTGRPAVDAADRAEVLRRIAFEDPAPPRKLDKAIPAELETVTLKCLAKNPSERYATAGELADDLRRWLGHQTIKAKPPSLRQKAAKWARRHRPAVAAVAVCAIAAVTALAGSTGWVASERAARRADVERRADDFLREAGRLYGEGKRLEALAEAEKAQAALDGGGTSEGIRRRVQESVTDLGMIGRLEGIRLQERALENTPLARGPASIWKPTDGSADQAYARAFREYGIDVDALDPAEAAGRIRAKGVRAELAAALDGWALVRRSSRPEGDGGWKRLLAVARTADPGGASDRVRLALERGSKEALLELAATVKGSELPPATVVLLGDALIAAGAADQAVRLLRPVQFRRPDDFWVNHSLARAFAKVQPPQRNEAVRYFTAALARRPQSPEAGMNLGIALDRLGRYDEAETVLREVTRTAPDYAPAYNILAWHLFERLDLDGAVAAEREAIRLKPDWGWAYHHLGYLLSAKRDWDGAIAAHREAYRLDPSLMGEEVVCITRTLRDGKGDVDAAVAVYQEALAKEPENLFIRAHFAEALAAKGNLDQAEAISRDVLRILPSDCHSHRILGEILDRRGKWGEAAVHFRACLRELPDRKWEHANLRNVLWKLGDWDGVVAACQDAILLSKNDDYFPHLDLGHALMAKGDRDGAVAAWRDGLRACENYLRQTAGRSKDAYWAQAKILVECDDARLQDPRRALELASKAVELGGRGAGEWGTVSLCHYRLGDWAGAIAAAEKALAKNKGDAQAGLILALAHVRLGHLEQARQWYEKVVRWLDEPHWGYPYPYTNRLRAEAAAMLGIQDTPKSARQPSP
jgi:serine/threonine protein kinase/Flp pilus assembly protein TadD